VELRTLQAFVEVVRTGGFSRAGATLHLAQPTVSKAVKSLEEDLGQPLLVREGRRVSLTDAGRVAFERARAILAAVRGLEDEVGEVGAVRRGHLRLGIPPMVGAAVFPPVLGDFRAAYPGVTLELREVGARSVEALVLEGEVEAGATLLPTDREAFEVLPLLRDVLRAVVHPSNPLARRRAVSLRDLEQTPFVLYREDFALHGRILAACRRAGFTPRIASESSQWDFMANMVAADVGVALLPSTICRRLDRAQVKVLSLAQPELRWDLALVWKRGRHLPPAARAFLEVARRHAPPAP
jgi:DNA-binding transcriptional LysR family regulator